MKNVFKLKLIVTDKNEEDKFRLFYLDVNKIESFYIPDEGVIGGKEEKSINIFVSGECFSVKQENHIIKFLTEEFVNPCIELAT